MDGYLVTGDKMKKIIATSLMALTLGAAAASAEVAVGLGYAISPMDDISTPGANIRVPIDFDFGLRIEPEIGISSSSEETTNNAGVTTKTEEDRIVVAVGGYYNLWKVKEVNMFAGGRLYMTKGSSDITTPAGTTGRDIDGYGARALFGAEYFFVQNISFTAQAGLEYMKESVGNDDTKKTGTVGELVLRYFFY